MSVQSALQQSRRIFRREAAASRIQALRQREVMNAGAASGWPEPSRVYEKAPSHHSQDHSTFRIIYPKSRPERPDILSGTGHSADAMQLDLSSTADTETLADSPASMRCLCFDMCIAGRHDSHTLPLTALDLEMYKEVSRTI